MGFGQRYSGLIFERACGGYAAHINRYGTIMYPTEFCEEQGLGTIEEAARFMIKRMADFKMVLTLNTEDGCSYSRES